MHNRYARTGRNSVGRVDQRALDVVVDRLARGLPVDVVVLAEPCQYPRRRGVTAGYVAGCRCPRCRQAWRRYSKAYARGRRLRRGRVTVAA